jgi:hypothetical protein
MSPHRRESFQMPKAIAIRSIPNRPIPNRSTSSPRRVKWTLLAAAPFIAALVTIPSLAVSAPATAQTPAANSPQDPSTTQPNSHPTPTHRRTTSHLKAISKPPLTPPAPDTTPTQALTAPVPQDPHWPANDHPAPARIVWDSHGLRIEAANASLSEILTEVSTLTGAKVDGFASDARVYGQYGPAPARDVLSQLLDGTGYNMIMIGDLGQGTPREIVLSTRVAGSAQPAVHPASSADDDADVDEPVQPQPNPIQPMRAPFNNPAGLRGPQFPPDMQRQQGQPGQPGQPAQPPQNPQQPNQQ